MIITITGTPGAGKTVIGRLIAKKLHYRYYSIGDMRRQMAKERGMTLAEFNALGEKEDFTDREVDDYQERLGKKQDNFVMNGRLAYHFIPHSLKLFFTVDEEIAAKRIMKDKREGEQFKNNQEAVRGIRARIRSDKRRYRKYYGIDPFEKKNYDFVLDTSKHGIDESAGIIVGIVKQKSKAISRKSSHQ